MKLSKRAIFRRVMRKGELRVEMGMLRPDEVARYDPAERGLRILAEMLEEAALVLASERPILRVVQSGTTGE